MNTNWTKVSAWEEFRNSGMLWFANMILHVFGWAIAVEIDDTGKITSAYPMHVRYRGFSEKINEDGYKKVSEYMANHIYDILAGAGGVSYESSSHRKV